MFLCPHETDATLRTACKQSLRQLCEKTGTSEELEQAIIVGITQWLKGNSRPRCPSTDYNMHAAYADQTSIGWNNMFLGLMTNEWSTLQHKYYKQCEKRNPRKRWLTMILRHLMNVVWDMWNQQCKWRHRDGNKREAKALADLDTAINKELTKGCIGIPQCSHYLFQETDELLDKSKFLKQCWPRVVEAARGKVPTNWDNKDITDAEDPSYEPQRHFLRQWMATGRF